MSNGTSGWSLRWFHHRLAGTVETLCSMEFLAPLPKGERNGYQNPSRSWDSNRRPAAWNSWQASELDRLATRSRQRSNFQKDRTMVGFKKFTCYRLYLCTYLFFSVVKSRSHFTLFTLLWRQMADDRWLASLFHPWNCPRTGTPVHRSSGASYTLSICRSFLSAILHSLL